MAERILPSDFLDLEAADLTERVGDPVAGGRGNCDFLSTALVTGDLWAVKLDMVIVESL